MLNPTQPLFFLLVYLAVLYVRPHEYLPGFMGLPLLPVSMVLAIVLWLARQPKNFEAPQFKLLPVQMLLMAWSVLVGGHWLGGSIITITEFFPVVLLFYMFATTIDSVAKLKQVFFVLSASAIPICLHCIDQAREEREGIGWTGAQMIDGRVTYLGFLNDPNDLSMALLMILPMQLYLARKSGWIFKLFWLGAAVLILDTLKLANSRGAILSVAAMMFHHGILRYGVIRSLLVGPVALAPVLIFGPSRVNEISDDEESAEGRIEAWHEGFQMLMQHPLFGVGKGMFTEYNNLTAHNSYVLAIAELGLIGFFVWFSSIVLSWMMMALVNKAGPSGALSAEPVVEPAPAPMAASGSGALTAPRMSNKIVVTNKASPAKPLSAGGAAVSTGAVGDPAAWDDVRDAARILWYGYTGALVCIFFLSRSYIPILYIHLALIVAMYQLARTHRPDILNLKFSEWWGRLLGMSVGAVIFLRLLTIFLLRH